MSKVQVVVVTHFVKDIFFFTEYIIDLAYHIVILRLLRTSYTLYLVGWNGRSHFHCGASGRAVLCRRGLVVRRCTLYKVRTLR